MSFRPLVVHLTTVSASLELLTGPQLSAIHAAGYDVIGMSASGPMIEELERRGIRHVPLDSLTRASSPSHDLRAMRDVYLAFRRLRPDIVHTHNPKPGLIGRLAARAAGVPVIVNTVHGLYAQPTDKWTKRALVYGLERVAAACSDAELVQNPEDLRVLRSIGVPPRRLHLLGNGVDLSRFRPDSITRDERDRIRLQLFDATTDHVVFGVVARLVGEKGLREVFSAASALRRVLPSARFVVVGGQNPEKRDALSPQEIRDAEDQGVRFLGMRLDVERLYPAMDVFVLASHREGFPRSAMEAAASSLPIIATNIRGCRQVVDDEVTGLLVPPRDSVALAQAIFRLARDPAQRRRMGLSGLAKAGREFDQQRQIGLLLATYARLLSQAGLDRER